MEVAKKRRTLMKWLLRWLTNRLLTPGNTSVRNTTGPSSTTTTSSPLPQKAKTEAPLIRRKRKRSG